MSEWVSESVTRSPIELFWTAKKGVRPWPSWSHWPPWLPWPCWVADHPDQKECSKLWFQGSFALLFSDISTSYLSIRLLINWWLLCHSFLFHLYLAMIWSPPSGAPDPAPLNVGGGGCAHQSLRLWHAAAPDLPLHLHLADMEYKCRKICAILYFKDKIALKCQNDQY